MLRTLRYFFKEDPLKTLLKQAKQENKNKFLILWNRGMGDLALGLDALNSMILQAIPHAEITYLTRSDLIEPFSLLPHCKAIEIKSMQRGQKKTIEEYCEENQIDYSGFHYLIESIDTNTSLHWQLGSYTPKLKWTQEHDDMSQKFKLPHKEFIGLHVSSETDQFYRYQKNWPKESFKQLIQSSNQQFLLFGFQPDEEFSFPNAIDLRGKTSAIELLSVIKNHCKTLVAPDSGVLSLIYYLDVPFPLKVVSLWSDPEQGILRQKVASPNPELKHMPLVQKDLAQLGFQEVQKCI